MKDVQSRRRTPPFTLGPFTSVGIAGLALMLSASAARAQVDLSGSWQDQNPILVLVQNGPPPGDFVGIPLNSDGRAMGATVDAGNQPEELNQQCQQWLVNYIIDGIGPLEIRPVTDPIEVNDILGWRMEGTVDRMATTVWVDGRAPPPPQALRTWGGYATGQWRGDTLAVTITHIRDGWMARNGSPQSDQATVSMFLSREGENQLTITYIIRDPVYLSAPYARAKTFRLSYAIPAGSREPYCLPAEVVSGLSDGEHAARYLPGKNPLIDNPQQNLMMKDYGIPLQVALGGVQEMYPWFQKVLSKEYKVPPGYCSVECCAGDGPLTIPGNVSNENCLPVPDPREPARAADN